MNRPGGSLSGAGALVASLLGSFVIVDPAGSQVLARSVFASGGATSGGGLLLRGSLGEPAIGAEGGPTQRVCAGFWCVEGFGVTDVSPLPPEPTTGLAFALGPAVPNPARPGFVRFDLTLPKPGGDVRIEVYDVAGRRLGGPLEHRLEAGRWRLLWNGAQSGAGVRFARVFVDGRHRADRRFVIVP